MLGAHYSSSTDRFTTDRFTTDRFTTDRFTVVQSPAVLDCFRRPDT